MGALLGADPDALDHLARALATTGDDLAATRKRLDRPIHSTPWNGRNADRFRRNWDHEYGRALVDAAAFLKEAGSELHRQADQQRDTSSTRGSGSFGKGYCDLPKGDPTKRKRSWIERVLGEFWDEMVEILEVVSHVLNLRDLLQMIGTIAKVGGKLVPIIGIAINSVLLAVDIHDLIFVHPYEGAFGFLESFFDFVKVGSGILGIVGGIMMMTPLAPIGAALTVVSIAGAGLATIADQNLEFWHKGGGRELWQQKVSPGLRRTWNEVGSGFSGAWRTVVRSGGGVVERASAPFRDAAVGLIGRRRRVFSW